MGLRPLGVLEVSLELVEELNYKIVGLLKVDDHVFGLGKVRLLKVLGSLDDKHLWLLEGTP